MDEAHLLKDRSSFRSKRLREIAHKAKQRLMLTGTPLQNDLQVEQWLFASVRQHSSQCFSHHYLGQTWIFLYLVSFLCCFKHFTQGSVLFSRNFGHSWSL